VVKADGYDVSVPGLDIAVFQLSSPADIVLAGDLFRKSPEFLHRQIPSHGKLQNSVEDFPFRMDSWMGREHLAPDGSFQLFMRQ